MKLQRVCRCMCIALLFLQPRHCSGMAGQRHAAATLPPAKILDTHCREDPEVFGKVYSVRSNDNGVRIVNFATSKNLVVKSTMFPHRNIHKCTRTSPDGQTHNQIDHILIDRRRLSSIIDVRSFKGADCDTITIWWWQKLGKDWQ